MVSKAARRAVGDEVIGEDVLVGGVGAFADGRGRRGTPRALRLDQGGSELLATLGKRL